MPARILATLMAPMLLCVAVSVAALAFSPAVQLHFRFALITTAIVVSLHTFTGNSGVISFGHISNVAIGAFSAGLMSIGPQQKAAVFPELFGVLRDYQIGNVASLVLATIMAAAFAFIIGLALMRLDGLSAGIATFAVLGITRNVLRNWTKIGPGAKTLPGVPQTTGLFQAIVVLVFILIVAALYQQSRFGRRLRATREDPLASQSVGISTYQERLVGFTLSGALGGLAGGAYVHHLGSITTEQVYLGLTFLTLAMLVIGGMGSIWGAVLGGLVVSGLSSFLSEAQNGIELMGREITFPRSSRDVTLGALMVLVMLVRPHGLSGGRELDISRQAMRFRKTKIDE